MKKRETVNARYEEKFVKTTIVYANTSNVLFYDAAKTDKVLKTELKDLFLKGVTIDNGSGALLTPVVCNADGLIAYSGTTTVTGTAFTGSDPS